MKKILFVFGTRPEAIKMAPLICEFQKFSNLFDVKVCVTGQHRQMLDQVLTFFDIVPDYDLDVMKQNQTLAGITSACLTGLEKVIKDSQPDIIFVQGDTTSAFTGALAGYYARVKVAHIEAGLRSHEKYAPFPEEINRILAGHIADYHFAPTEQARHNLIREGIVKNVEIVSNTVVDALLMGLGKINTNSEQQYFSQFHYLDFSNRILLITGHRRESFGCGFEQICKALKEIAIRNPKVQLVYPVHLNPQVREPVQRILGHMERVFLIDPLDYPALIWLMSKSYLIITDSGGIQEEAPSLGKPVLVIRECTERMEGVLAGTAKLVGTSSERIVSETQLLLDTPTEYQRMSQSLNPYGDGKGSERIVRFFIREFFGEDGVCPVEKI